VSQKHNGLSHFPNAAFDIVALGASLGGLKALSQILSTLPPDFPAGIVIVQHLSPRQPSFLAEILKQRTLLKVKQAEAEELLQPETVYIAPPNKHLLVNSDRTLSLSDSAQVHFVRPAVNNLFESVALSFKQRAIAVILTGKEGDGARGVQAIKIMGGTVIAQDASSSEAFSMPKAAIDTGSVDFVLPLNQISSTLRSLVMVPVGAGVKKFPDNAAGFSLPHCPGKR